MKVWECLWFFEIVEEHDHDHDHHHEHEHEHDHDHEHDHEHEHEHEHDHEHVGISSFLFSNSLEIVVEDKDNKPSIFPSFSFYLSRTLVRLLSPSFHLLERRRSDLKIFR